ncbi:taste receptor type 2 member 120 [Rattus norvegicus]|uniref:Taste receptor type 2 member 120 n=1 Tax=Rattus norvegicus TaxID=10116 RepID=TR120_RAT|nr:taste receptor type 2 member 120 [Rattus norvegicus]Q67ET3.1 RecName: Full=Taste receptor type 2 member 120; Short=T2R120; AltName: Full=Taste receptor type 2 member 17; Short=T2R17 [Rattus norvegicus]AAR13346.1 putative taste receptor T2R17 [Rattus norvegicus]|eukprot:NP_001074406.1 taste receptor type 2 member 120 [Rattus norvegicus]
MDLTEWIVTIIMMIEFLLGNCANFFIMVVNAIDCMKRRKISSADRIITALAISRIGLLWAMLMNWHSRVYTTDTYSFQVTAFSGIIWAITNHFTTWLGTILSMFYLFKIANFSNCLFLHLKRKLDSVLLVIFLVSSLLVFAYLGVVNIKKIAWLSVHEGNVTVKSKLMNIASIRDTLLFSLINIAPFGISLTCVLLLIYSLGKHLKNMKFYGKGCQDQSTMVHIRALQTVVSFLLLYATYSSCVIISGWSIQNVPIFLFCVTIGAFYPAGHSCILIWGNQKLKQFLLLFLRQMKC